MSKFQNTVKKGEQIQWSDKMVSDWYHCDCEYCDPNKFMGELFCATTNKFYSQHIRKGLLPDLKDERYVHNNAGQSQGYIAAIQKFTEPGDLVFDPTVGSGTAVWAAEQNGRKGIGIELEFPDSARYCCEGKGTIIEGNCLEVDLDFDADLEEESIQLIINGTPYPVLDGATQSSDIHTSKDRGGYGDYRDKNNIGKWKIAEYKDRIHEMYTRFIPYLKPGGYFMIGIKDPCHNKAPFNLHKIIIDSVLKHNPELEYHGWWIHKHLPQTFFMSTYEKQHGVKPPLHQTFIVLKKIDF